MFYINIYYENAKIILCIIGLLQNGFFDFNMKTIDLFVITDILISWKYI
jgi:hypothetical protein